MPQPASIAVPSVRWIIRRGLLALVLTLTAALSAGASDAADKVDNLDTALNAHAQSILRYLRDHNCRNVGILKFRIKKGDQPVSFRVGPLNDNLAERLETALILANKQPAPIGIIHDASHIAASRNLPQYDKPAGQRALFEQEYPLAWGDTLVHPDQFLTGIVRVRPDLKSATVVVEAFGPQSPKQDRVLEFQFQTDRSLLADLNESFQVKSRQLKKHSRDIDLDEDAAQDAADRDKPANNTSSSDEKLLDYQICYDNVVQAVTADPTSPGELRLAEPTEGQVVTILFRSLAHERIGLVLMVNEKSTLYEQQGQPASCLAWVLEPGRQYMIKGYQQDNQTFKPFRVLSAAESAAAPYNENTGLIQFHLFRSGAPGGSMSITGKDATSKDDTTGQSMNISLRGLSRSALVNSGHTRSLAALQQAYGVHARSSRHNRGLIDVDPNLSQGAIQNDEVKNPVYIQSIVVRYFKPNRN
jgi:hypothetical protein